MTSASSTLYPRYCFDLAPTTNKWCFFRAAAIQKLDQHVEFAQQNIFFHGNLPIIWARVVGVVVAVDDIRERRIFTIDDSSGACIECNVAFTRAAPAPAQTTGPVPATSKSHPHAPGAKDLSGNTVAAVLGAGKITFEKPGCDGLDVGSVVDIKGKLATFREEMTIRIESVRVLHSTEQEVTLWEKRTAFERDVLDRPWVLSEKEIARCRRKAEKEHDETRNMEGKRKRGKETQKGSEKMEKRRGEGSKGRHGMAEAEGGDTQRDDAGVMLDGYGRPKKRKGPLRPPNKRDGSQGQVHEHGQRSSAGTSSGPSRTRSSRIVLDDSIKGKYDALGL